MPERTVLAGSDIGLKTLTQPPEPPEITARSAADLTAARVAAAPERLEALANRARARTRPGPELALFFEAPIGRAYLAAGPAKALARGAPAESCPAFGAALAHASRPDAASAALELCLAGLPSDTRADCGCRLIAVGDVLLAEASTFEYARTVSARLIGRADGAPVDLSVVIDGPDPSGRGAPEDRRLSVRTVSGPAGVLEIDADGAARLSLGASDAPALYEGQWRAEGFRRGRLAGVAGLTGPSGAPLALLIGYAPAEVSERREELLARARELAP